MRKYSNNWVFIDLLFNLLVGFTSLFIIAFMLINPIAKDGTIDPPIVFLIESSWDDESDRDIDLYVRGPDGEIVYFANKDGSYMVLERDDLGSYNDRFIINGKEEIIKRNYEMVSMSSMPPGEYTINVHYYSYIGEPEKVNIRATKISPYQTVVERDIELIPRQEATIVNFIVEDDMTVTDIRTDINIVLREFSK